MDSAGLCIQKGACYNHCLYYNRGVLSSSLHTRGFAIEFAYEGFCYRIVCGFCQPLYTKRGDKVTR